MIHGFCGTRQTSCPTRPDLDPKKVRCSEMGRLCWVDAMRMRAPATKRTIGLGTTLLVPETRIAMEMLMRERAVGDPRTST